MANMNYDSLVSFLKTSGVQLLYGILVLVVGFFLIHWLMKLLDRNERIIKMEPTVKGFITHLIRLILSILVILTAANIIGIPMTSIVTLVASAGVAISLALQGALGNLVGGFTLLILKPIQAGEYVKVGEYDGTVKTVGSFYTELITPDNRKVTLPNSSLTNAAIINFSREGTRRLDLTFSVNYQSDIQQVRDTLLAVAARCEYLLPDPAPAAMLQKMNDSSLDFILRVWTESAHYWDVYFFLTTEGKIALDQAGIEIPYPQLDVHIRDAAPAGENGLR